MRHFDSAFQGERLYVEIELDTTDQFLWATLTPTPGKQDFLITLYAE